MENTGKGNFQSSVVLHILRNPYYKGCVKHKGQSYPGEHKAIIDEATWDEVQEIFKRHGS